MTTTDDRDAVRGVLPATPAAHGRPHRRQAVPGHLPPEVRRRVLPPGAEHQRQRVLPGHREREPDPTVGALGRGRRRRCDRHRRSRRRRAARRGVGSPEGQAPVHADRAGGRRPSTRSSCRTATGGRRSSAGATRCSPSATCSTRTRRPRSCRSASSATTTTTWTSSRGRSAYGAVLVANQEYTNENIMFPPATTPEELDEQRRIAIAAHGMAVVQLYRTRKGKPWTYAVGAPLNRRITGNTPFTFSGPAAGSALLRTVEDPTGTTARGTLGNCAGGTTPWGTVLSGEENFNGYFRTAGTSAARPALRPRGQGDLPRLGVGRPAVRRAHARATRTSRTGSGGSSRSTRSTRTARPSSTPRSAGSSTRAPTSSSAAPAARWRTWATTSGSTTCTSSSRRTPTARARACAPAGTTRRCSPRAACTSPGSPGTRRSPRSPGPGRCPSDGAFDGTGRVDPARASTASATCPASAPTRSWSTPGSPRTPSAPRRWTAARTSSRTRRRVASTSSAPTTPTAASPARRARPSRTLATNNRDGHIIEITEAGNDAAATTLRLEHPAALRRPGDEHLDLLRGVPGRPGLPHLLPGQRHVRLRRGTCGWRPTARRASSATATACSRCRSTGPERGRVQQFLSVPAEAETCGPVVRDDGRDGLRRRAAPRRERHLGAAALVLPRLRGAGHGGRRRVGRAAAERHPGLEALRRSRPRASGAAERPRPGSLLEPGPRRALRGCHPAVSTGFRRGNSGLHPPARRTSRTLDHPLGRPR